MIGRGHIGLSLIAVAAASGAVWALGPQEPFRSPTGAVLEPRASTGGDELRELLGGVDYVPDRPTLDQAIDTDEPADTLIALARAEDPDTDQGVRLRAYRALAMYQGMNVESALVQGVHEHRAVRDGVDVVYLRAAMSSLATVARKDAVPTLELVLDHGNPDARAAAADALVITRSREALPHLYQRRGVETHALVIVALESAIRTLSNDIGTSD